MGWTIGAYEVIGTIGGGPSTAVCLAQHLGLQRQVVLKRLSPRLVADAGSIERFRRQAEVMARLDHPNCVRVLEFFEAGGDAYVAMDHVPGASLRAVVQGAGRLSPEQAFGVLRGVLSGLAHAHSLGLVHGDLKPENIIADPEGTAKLVDFGQAAAIDPAAGDTGGGTTPSHISPEQAGGEPASAQSDLYAASAILYELLTGQPPFGAGGPMAVVRRQATEPTPDARRLNPNLTEGTAVLVARGMARDPAKRHRTGATFLAALEAAAEGAYGRDWEAASSIRALVEPTVATAGAASETSTVAKSPPPGSPRTLLAAGTEPSGTGIRRSRSGRRGLVAATMAAAALGLALGAGAAYADVGATPTAATLPSHAAVAFAGAVASIAGVVLIVRGH